MKALAAAHTRARVAAKHLLDLGPDPGPDPGSGRAGPRSERGDVPGWVLVTLMTAGLVTVLWAVARTELVSMFQRALSSVTG